jgi:hypothetical protein
MTRSLADADGARDARAVHLIREVFGHFFDHLAGKQRATVIHRHHDTLHPHVRVDTRGADLVDHVHDLGESFETEPLALERDEDFIGGGERGGHQHAERRRCVENAEFKKVVGLEGLQDAAQAGEVVIAAGEFDFHAGEVHFRGHEREVFPAGRQNLLVHGGIAHQHRIHAAACGGFDAESAGAVRLRVEIHQQDALPAECEGGGKIQGGGGFSHPSLLVGYGDDDHGCGIRTRGLFREAAPHAIKTTGRAVIRLRPRASEE